MRSQCFSAGKASPLSDFDLSVPRPYGEALLSGAIRARATDFQVTEELGFVPEGQGEHAWLWIRKCGANTHYVAKRLADWANVSVRDVGYAGLKDRHAVTAQWFSIYLPGRPTPPLPLLPAAGHNAPQEGERIEVLLATRGRRKLKRGVHRANAFRLRLTGIHVEDPDQLLNRLQTIAEHGVPNAFGPQRFGHFAENLTRAAAWFDDGRRPRQRHARGLILSAARSWLFNQYLAARITDGTWNQCIDGEWLTTSAEGKSEPTGPLFGRGDNSASGQALALELAIAARYPTWIDGLEKAGLTLNRRRLVSRPRGFQWTLSRCERALDLAFTLPRGEFATTVLSAFGDIRDVAAEQISDAGLERGPAPSKAPETGPGHGATE